MRWNVGVARSLLPKGLLLSALILGTGCRPKGPAPLAVTFLSVGQGDCTVLQQGDEAILIDAGPKVQGYDAGERIVRRRLRELGVARVRAILLTHDDSDHIGGTGAILRSYAGATALVGPQSRIPLGPRVQRLPAEGTVAFGEFRLRWRYPISDGPVDNARSSLVAMSARGMTMAFTGDSPTGFEEGVADLTGGTVNVYKAGHHGSKSSSSAELLARLRPRFVVVSCGAGNRYGHPHPDSLARYRDAGARVLRTDREGDIAFRTSGPSGAEWELVTTRLDPTLSR